MDFITIFFIAMVLGTIVLAPRFGADSRRSDWSPARPWSLR